MEIMKVPTTHREREQSGSSKRRPRPKAGEMAKANELADPLESAGTNEHRLDVTA